MIADLTVEPRVNVSVTPGAGFEQGCSAVQTGVIGPRSTTRAQR